MYFCGKFYSLCKARRVNVEGSPFGLRRAKGSVKSKENVSEIRGKVLKKRRGTSVKSRKGLGVDLKRFSNYIMERN